MTPVFYDFETFWSVTHSLTKMNPIAYIMHPDTEIQSVAVAVGDGPIEVIFGEDQVIAFLCSIDWSDKMAVAHNGSGFDHLILAWRLGIKPKAWGCTLAMARPFYGVTVGGSLAKVAFEMGLEAKGDLEQVNTKGKKFVNFTHEEIEKMRVYNKQDTKLCRDIFNGLSPLLGTHEMRLIDATIRMATDLKFVVDFDLLNRALAEEREKKRVALLDLAGVSGIGAGFTTEEELLAAVRSVVMSQPKFALLLEQLGVEVPLKPSPSVKDSDGLPKMIPALAKNDKGMTDLLEYESPDGDEEKTRKVQVAAAARLEVKTTQLETRLQTFIEVGKACSGYLPIPLNYCGAVITWRHSGAMKMNGQNLPRIDPDIYKTSDALRRSIRAPKGFKIVVADSSNIELRVAHKLAGQHDTIEKLKNKEDLYCWFASQLYGRPITKADKLERFIGKVAMLSLQYGSSWKTFQNMARVLSKGKVLLDEFECKDIVNKWRGMFQAISGQRGIWKKCDEAIISMVAGRQTVIDVDGLCTTDEGRIWTPQNHWLQYPSLHQEKSKESGKSEWIYGQGRNRSRIYGAHLFENLCQHLARIIVMEQTLVANKKYPLALSCHDEAVFVVPEDKAEQCEKDVVAIMSTSPSWWPDIPLAAEAGIGNTYGEAK